LFFGFKSLMSLFSLGAGHSYTLVWMPKLKLNS
jgi:hypothetical protein